MDIFLFFSVKEKIHAMTVADCDRYRDGINFWGQPILRSIPLFLSISANTWKLYNRLLELHYGAHKKIIQILRDESHTPISISSSPNSKGEGSTIQFIQDGN